MKSTNNTHYLPAKVKRIVEDYLLKGRSYQVLTDLFETEPGSKEEALGVLRQRIADPFKDIRNRANKTIEQINAPPAQTPKPTGGFTRGAMRRSHYIPAP